MSRARPLVAAISLLALCAGPAIGQAVKNSGRGVSEKYGELLNRIPDQTNLIMLVDVQGLFDSPFGKANHWREMATQNAAEGMGLGPEISKAAIAASIDLEDLNENWLLGMSEMRQKLPDLGKLARREGGYVEKINSTPVVWTPRGFYLFTAPPLILGVVYHSDRQALTKWIFSSPFHPRSFPPGYADRAIHRADEGSQLVLVLNLADAISVRRTEPWLNTIQSVKDARLDPKLLAERLATAKSVYIKVDVAQDIQGTLQIEFDSNLEYASIVAKELIMTLLDEYGASLPGLEKWHLQIDKNMLTMSGPLPPESLRRLLSLARPPRLSSEQASSTSSPGEASEEEAEANLTNASESDILKGSQAYFRSVTDLLDGLKGQQTKTYASKKIWYEKYAKRIEELPILGVDSELLDWGAKVARTLREMAAGVNYYAKNQSYTLASVPNGYYAGYGYYTANSKGYDQAVLKRQSDAKMSVDLDTRWQVMETSIADMRRKMVEKYKTDF